jgi:hypothetical protein
MLLKKIKSKKGALELSIGTIVILVLAMSMLILGLVLVRTIFKGAQGTVDITDEKVKAEINKLFAEEQKSVLYLPNRLAKIKQGEPGDVAFAIQNTAATQEFTWKVELSDDKVKTKCGVTESQAEDWITTGGSGEVNIASGDKYYDVIRFNIPEGAVNDISTCLLRYRLIIEKEDGSPYDTLPFDVDAD